MIQHVGGRDRRVVHVDRLQRYVESAQSSVVLTSRPKLNQTGRSTPGDGNSTGQPRRGGDGLRSFRERRAIAYPVCWCQKNVTSEISRGRMAKSRPISGRLLSPLLSRRCWFGRSQRRRLKPWRLRNCRRMHLRSLQSEARIDATMYQCAACGREFASCSGRSRHTIIVHQRRWNGELDLLDIPSELSSETATKARARRGPRRKRLAVSPSTRSTAAPPSLGLTVRLSPISRGISRRPSPTKIAEGSSPVDEAAVAWSCHPPMTNWRCS